MVFKLAPQGEIHHIRVEPEAPLALNTRIQIDAQGHPVVQGVPDRRVHRVLDSGVEQEDAPLHADIGGTHFQDAIERIGARLRRPGAQNDRDEHGSQMEWVDP